MNPYDILGVDKTADTATIKRTYRKRAQKAHPDKGGAPEDFHRLTRAYKLLANPETRERYDRTGEADDNTGNELLYAKIADLLFQAMNKTDRYTNVVQVIMRAVEDDQQRIRGHIRENEREAAQLRKALKRFTHKGGGANILAQIIQGKITAIEHANARAAEGIDQDQQMLALLADYEYRPDEMPSTIMMFSNMTSTAG